MLTPDLAETFLAVYDSRNITAAAQALHVGQSTVSTRIRQLEAEVHEDLFLRGRGYKQLVPTAAGEAFRPLALEWVSLDQKSHRLSSLKQREELVVGAPELINGSLFLPFYRLFAQAHPEIRLRLRTHHTPELYEMLGARQIDIGFTFSTRRDDEVAERPLFSDEKVVLTSADQRLPDTVSISVLPADKEIYLRYGDAYEEWHWTYLDPSGSLLHAPNVLESIGLLNIPGAWMIVPASVYRTMAQREEYACSYLKEQPPDGIYYEITRKNPATVNTGVLEVFRQELDAWLNTSGFSKLSS